MSAPFDGIPDFLRRPMPQNWVSPTARRRARKISYPIARGAAAPCGALPPTITRVFRKPAFAKIWWTCQIRTGDHDDAIVVLSPAELTAPGLVPRGWIEQQLVAGSGFEPPTFRL